MNGEIKHLKRYTGELTGAALARSLGRSPASVGDQKVPQWKWDVRREVLVVENTKKSHSWQLQQITSLPQIFCSKTTGGTRCSRRSGATVEHANLYLGTVPFPE